MHSKAADTPIARLERRLFESQQGVYACMYVKYKCTSICIVYIYMYMNMYMCVCIHIYTYIYMYMYVCLYVSKRQTHTSLV